MELRSIRQASVAAMVQLPQSQPGAPHHRRPPPALAPGQHPARPLAGRIHDRTDQRPQRARLPRRSRAGPSRAAGDDLLRPHHHGGRVARGGSLGIACRAKAEILPSSPRGPLLYSGIVTTAPTIPKLLRLAGQGLTASLETVKVVKGSPPL